MLASFRIYAPVLLVGVAVYTILGGMLSVLVTDFLQFVVMSGGLLAVTLLILFKVGWGNMTAAVEAVISSITAFRPVRPNWSVSADMRM